MDEKYWNLFLDHDKLISPIVLLKDDSPIDDCDGIGAFIYPACYDDSVTWGGIWNAFDPIDTDSEGKEYFETIGSTRFLTTENETFYSIPSNITDIQDAIDLLNLMEVENFGLF